MKNTKITTPCETILSRSSGFQRQQDRNDSSGNGTAKNIGNSKVMNIVITTLVVTVLIAFAISWMSAWDPVTSIATVSWNG